MLESIVTAGVINASIKKKFPKKSYTLKNKDSLNGIDGSIKKISLYKMFFKNSNVLHNKKKWFY